MLKYTEYKQVFLELPEEVSLAFSISSCPNLCRGCHSPELRKDIGTPIEECFKIIHKYRKHITAICLLGHGGLQHKEEFIKFLEELKTKFPELKIGLYSGLNYMIEEYKPYLDYYKVGEYIEELGGLDCPKTTNQIIHKLKR